MYEFHDSNGNGFGDMWWTDKCTYFSSIDTAALGDLPSRLPARPPAVATLPLDVEYIYWLNALMITTSSVFITLSHEALAHSTKNRGDSWSEVSLHETSVCIYGHELSIPSLFRQLFSVFRYCLSTAHVDLFGCIITF